jgi:ABC-type polar amino acid transport system ATPase subunit
MGFARKISSRVVFMDQGAIVEQGEPGQFFEAAKTERARRFLEQFEE